MARKTRAGMKKLNRTWSTESAVTFATIPSGVTINNSHINDITVAELDYLDGAGGPVVSNPHSVAGNMISFSTSAVTWAGASVSVASASHGLTTLLSFNAIYTDGDTASVATCRFHYTPSGVSIDVIAQTLLGGTTTIPASSGGTIQWQAFGI